jgi:hypothetical protein
MTTSETRRLPSAVDCSQYHGAKRLVCVHDRLGADQCAEEAGLGLSAPLEPFAAQFTPKE